MRRASWWRVVAGVVVLIWAGTAGAQPALTTIQDVLFTADGKRFSGYAFIQWKSFQAADATFIATQSVTTAIVNGNLRVRLVPTTNVVSQAYYQVRYQSDGRIQFTENWAVPPSGVTLKLKDVRLASAPGPGTTSGAGAGGQEEIPISDVIGLQNELNIRPIKGPGFLPDRAARINTSGEIEAVSGNLADCVKVDGTAGACTASGAAPGFVDGETPAGLVNGSNTVFTVASAPDPLSSLALHRNGVLQKATLDFTLVGNTITFTGAATPQTGDTLLAWYRVQSPAAPTGAAGGHLTGFYPNPTIALGVLSNANVSSIASIAESKLALTFPTHSNANDPTAGEKAALAGTTGAPSGTNKFVTDMDARMTDARAPTAHALLSTLHGDTTAATVARGDLLVGQGTAATWSKLSVGPANRCLMSNGFDAVWNTCLFTGFSTGSVPFVDPTGILVQQNSAFFWDSTNRRLGVGTNAPIATMSVHDATPATGVTGLSVRGGQAQAATPLQRWLDSSGVELAKVDSDGSLSVKSLRTTTTATKAGWQDSGSTVDPSNRANGDLWMNTSQQARKSMEAGQVHPLPQVLCSSTGGSTSSTTPTVIGSCFAPAFFFDAGDRIDIRFDYAHIGTSTGFTATVNFGAATLIARSAGAGEIVLTGKTDGALHATGIAWGVQTWGSTTTFSATTGAASAVPTSAFTIAFLGNMASSTSDSVALRNFTVIRYPAQSNP